MNRLLIALCCLLAFAIPALAAPGEPRFLQGTVEWPAALNGEPVMIVRGDDGRVYVADVSGARRQGAEPVRAGGRVALLVIEGARAHDVTAIVIGPGDATSLARALSQGGVAAPAATAAATPPAAPSPAPVAAPPAAAPAPAPVAAPAAVAVAPPVAPSAPAPVATVTPPATAAPPAAATAPVVAKPAAPAPVAPGPPAPAPVAPPAAATAAAPAPTAPAPAAPAAAAPAPAPAAAPPTVIATPPPAAVPTAPAPAAQPPAVVPPAVVPPAPNGNGPTKVLAPPGERKQWARVDGKVQSVEGALLVLKADNGTVILVDISQLNPNVSQALRRGRLVSVYGYPLEQKFEAAGYIELDPSHPEPPRLRQGR